MKKMFFIAVFLGLATMGANAQKLLYQGNYYMSGNGTDRYNNYTQAPSRELYIEIYDDHVVASGVYCEDASTKEWAQRNNRMICYAYAYQTYYIQGCLTEEFLKVDKKTYDVTLFIRQQNPYSSNYPNLFYFPFSKKSQGGGQYQSQQYQQQQYQQQQSSQQQSNPGYTPRPTEPKDCGVCYGTGKCRTCGGRGTVTNLGIGSGTHPCPNCPNHSGRCQWCNGTGKSN